MSVVDGTLPPHLLHSVYPKRSSDSPLEPVGRWLERLLCCSVVFARSAFRKARDPRVVQRSLEESMEWIKAGNRHSSRLGNIQPYPLKEESDEEDFPPIRKRSLSGPSRRRSKKSALVTRLVELTDSNDPMKDREPLVEGEDITADEINGFVYADRAGLESVNDFEGSLAEWNLSMLVLKDAAGVSTMRTLRSLSDDPAIAGPAVASLATKNLVLQRRVRQEDVDKWSKGVEGRGWCGWIMLEWLSRCRGNTGGPPLSTSQPRGRATLAAFLSEVCTGMLAGPAKTTVHKCVLKLRERHDKGTSSGEGLWLDAKILSELNLGFNVVVWEVNGSVASLMSSTEWGVGPHTPEQVEAALGCRSHMAFSLGHFFMFPVPAGFPNSTELFAQMASAARAEYAPLPSWEEQVASAAGDRDPLVPGVEPVVLDPLVTPSLHPYFQGLSQRQLDWRTRPGRDREATALSTMCYNVDSLNDLKLNFVCQQAFSLKLDCFHLLDTRVSKGDWPRVKNQFENALMRTCMKWQLFFFEGGITCVDGKSRCTIGGQIVACRHRCTKVKCESIIKLGGAVSLAFNIGKTQFASISTYWPCINEAPGSFKSLLEKEYNGMEALPTIRHGLEMAASAASEAGRLVLVAGDFNSDISRSDTHSLRAWVSRLGLSNASVGSSSTRPSYVRPNGSGESRIDHVFVSNPKTIISCSPYDPEGRITQHLPMFTQVSVDFCSSEMIFQGRKRVNMMHSPANRGNRIAGACKVIEAKRFGNWDDPEVILRFIREETVKVCTLSRGARREKDGWSPVTKGLTMNLRAIMTMLRHVNGFRAHKNLQWDRENFRPGLNAILRKWRQHGGKISNTDQAKDAFCNLSRYGEVFWHTVSWDELVSALPTAYKLVKSMLHGADRSRRRLEMNARVAKIEERVKQGRTGAAIRHILGPKTPGFDLSSLRIDGDEITDQRVINVEAAAHMKRWFEETPDAMPGSLGGPKAVWSHAFESELVFLSRTEASGIPENRRRHLWKHFQKKAVSTEESTLIAVGRSLDEMRPLLLLEVLRKVWAGIFRARMVAFLERNNLLHPSQHGAMRGCGTDTAAPIFVNAIETAKEWNSSVFISSWDVKRAFDSLAREFQIAALVRLGIPEESAIYFVELDGGGEIAVRTPLNETTNCGIGGWADIVLDGYVFGAGRGTGQGDPLSPLIFACCMDPLICALEDVDGGDFYVQGLDQVSCAVPDIAYVDDAISITGTFKALQTKADIMSAFALVVNIELSLKKLRTFAVQWGNPHRPDHSHLKVHVRSATAFWVPTLVPLLGAGEFTHLGVTYNMNLSNPELFHKASNTIEELGTKVALSLMSPDTKKMVFETCIFMKVAYYAKFSSWSLAEFKKLDQKVSRFYRIISKNRMSFPSALLYLPVKEGGLGFKRLSDVIQMSKLTLMGRLLTVGGSAGKAMEALVLRGFRAAGQFLPPGVSGTMGPSLGPVSWITSLNEWLAEVGVGIHRPGCRPVAGNPSMLDLLGVGNVQRREAASLRGIGSLAEICMVGDVNPPAVPGMEWVTEFPPAPLSCIDLRVGQVWSFANRNERLFEILGFLPGDRLSYITWAPVLSQTGVRVGDTVCLDEENFCQGAGGPRSLDTATFLHEMGGQAVLVFLSQERHWKAGVTVATVLGSRVRHPARARVNPPPDLWDRLLEMAGSTSQIYTDGSKAAFSDVKGFYEGTVLSKSSAGLVFYYPDDNVFSGVHISGQSALSSSYMTEMLALALGARLAEAKGVIVHSDCAAALGSLRQRQNKRVHSSPYWQLDMLLDLESLVKSAKVKAHPERRAIKVLTLQDRGIMAADDVAGSARFADLTVTSEEVLHMLTSFSKLSLVRLADQSVAVDNLDELRVAASKAAYLADRDTVRTAAGRPSKWARCNTQLGALTLMGGKCGLASQGCASRMQFDWYYWGSNRAKSGTALASDSRCPLCNGTEDQQHVLTSCAASVTVRAKVWGMLDAFLLDVQSGNTPAALDEARDIARADPRKEKARLKREVERQELISMRDLEAWQRLSGAGYALRVASAAARKKEREALRVTQRAQAIRLVRGIHGIMMTHPEGWSLMLGMPSAAVLVGIQALPDATANMSGYVSAEVRRFHRAIGMSTWEVITAHNRAVGALRSPSLEDHMAPAEGDGELEEFEGGRSVIRGRWQPGRNRLKGAKERQASIASWALLPADAEVLLDALEFAKDMVVVEAEAADMALLASYPASSGPKVGNRPGAGPIWVPNSGSANLLTELVREAQAKPSSVKAAEASHAPRATKVGVTRPVVLVTPRMPSVRGARAVGHGVVARTVPGPVTGLCVGAPSRFSPLLEGDSEEDESVLAKRTQPPRVGKAQSVRCRRFRKVRTRESRTPLHTGADCRGFVEYDIRDPDPVQPESQFLESRFSKIPVVVPLAKVPFTKKFRRVSPVIVEGAGDLASVGVGVPKGDGVVDLTALPESRNVSVGRWMVEVPQALSAGSEVVLHRRVCQDELARHSGRIDGFGMCGYLALEWASRRPNSGQGNGLDVRQRDEAVRLADFIGQLVVGCQCRSVVDKFVAVQTHLRTGEEWWRLDQASGLWLSLGDLPHLTVQFDCVVWGVEMGNGLRRVAHPQWGVGPISPRAARDISVIAAQVILDASHFHPLDVDVVGAAPLLVSLGLLTLQPEGSQSAIGSGPVGGTEVCLSGPRPREGRSPAAWDDEECGSPAGPPLAVLDVPLGGEPLDVGAARLEDVPGGEQDENEGMVIRSGALELCVVQGGMTGPVGTRAAAVPSGRDLVATGRVAAPWVARLKGVQGDARGQLGSAELGVPQGVGELDGRACGKRKRDSGAVDAAGQSAERVQKRTRTRDWGAVEAGLRGGLRPEKRERDMAGAEREEDSIGEEGQEPKRAKTPLLEEQPD